jgi:Asp-tRNA(Asn)/Glu-tRNA(Gln) amidotransferase A subunit family amidase
MTFPHTLPTASEAAMAIRQGRLTSIRLVQACLNRIAEVEPVVEAWSFLDPAYAVAQAEARDRAQTEGKSLGPLHGIPVGVKDIFDTADMPTENGTVLHAGRRPTEDAMVVALLRAAGAVILGKTVTTELAVYAPGKTRNPHDPGRSPGGSSSGSAAAVAARMVPLAIGSQTNGSVIRPAAYCGVVGYKPTHGLISRAGVLRQSPHLDHVGVFAQSVEDAALIAETLMAYDPRDPAMRCTPCPRLLELVTQDPPSAPRLAFVRSPFWDQAAPEARTAFQTLARRLACEETVLPTPFAEAAQIHRTIMEADLALSFSSEYERGKERLSPILRTMIEQGRQTLAVDYNRAVAAVPGLRRALDDLLRRYDAILTPATTGVAPAGLASTGSPIFCTIWTLCGVPAVTIPLLTGEQGLPLGVQLIGRTGDDARLLRTARWLMGLFQQPVRRTGSPA